MYSRFKPYLRKFYICSFAMNFILNLLRNIKAINLLNTKKLKIAVSVIHDYSLKSKRKTLYTLNKAFDCFVSTYLD